MSAAAVAPASEVEVATKATATAQARAALAGYELVPLPDGGFCVRRWGLVRALPNLAAVQQFLTNAGVKA